MMSSADARPRWPGSCHTDRCDWSIRESSEDVTIQRQMEALQALQHSSFQTAEELRVRCIVLGHREVRPPARPPACPPWSATATPMRCVPARLRLASALPACTGPQPRNTHTRIKCNCVVLSRCCQPGGCQS